MSQINWRYLWATAQADPNHRAVFTLQILNGLRIEQIRQLATATLDLDGGWVALPDGETYPLVTQAIDALRDPNLDLASMDFNAACDTFADYEAESHRQLAGAIWITDEALQITLETAGHADVPLLPLRFVFPFSVTARLELGERSQIATEARQTLQTAADWLVQQSLSADVSLVQRVIGVLRQGSLVFLIASTGVSGLNLIHNVLMGRLLSPADYSQLTLIITLQLLVGLLAAAMQTVTARFSARYTAQQETGLLALLARQMNRFGWGVGAAAAIVVLLLSPVLINAFQLAGFAVLLPVIIALPFFVRTGVDRGILQGVGGYFWLSAAYITEGVLRLVLSVILGYALLDAGRSLDGAIWGLAQSMFFTWLIAWVALRHQDTSDTEHVDESHVIGEWQHLGRMTALVLIGQALITNSDFLLVKNFFSPEDAGLYAAVSVLGRIVYFGALPLTILLVPLVARRQALDEPTQPILMLLIGGGGVVCGGLILGSALFAEDILRLLYGLEYIAAAGLLAPYALAASLYTLTNLVITYQIALGSGGETGLPILAGILQIVGVLAFHDSLAQVITIQIVLMGLLFGMVLWRVLSPRATVESDPLAAASGDV